MVNKDNLFEENMKNESIDASFIDFFGSNEDSDNKSNPKENKANNDKGKKSSPAITSVKQVLENSAHYFNQGLLYIARDKEEFFQGYNFIINQNIPELKKAGKSIVIDDFSMLFAALCTTYWQLHISILCGIKDIGENPGSLKPKLIQCLKKIIARDAELYTDKEINFFFSFHLPKDAWHQKKCIAVKKFVKKFECEDEDFSYILFYISSRFIDVRFNNSFCHKLYIASLYCAYISNKHFIHNKANEFVISKLFKYKKEYQHSSKNLTLSIASDSAFENPFFRNIDTILDLLDLESFIITASGYYPDDDFEERHSRQHPRIHFIKSEQSIIRLLKWCLGKSYFNYKSETLCNEEAIDCLYNLIQIPQKILRKYPAIVFLIYWSISYIKYNDFKSLFVEKTKPNAFSKTEGEKHPYIKHSEYDKFTRNKFITINKDPALVLQLLLYFGILDLVPNEIDLINEFDKAMHDSNWFIPKNQLELLNKLLDYKKLPIVTKEIDFCRFDGDGFSKTESAVNLIYNIISFNSTNPEMGIVQQVNHLDELRDRLFKYHNASWNDASEPEKDDYKTELYLLQSIDCGFEINNVRQTNLNHHGTGCSRDFTCKLFSETDNSCVPTTKDYNLYRHQYRSMLSKLYIKITRNMFVHYAPYKPTLKLLEIRNFNDLLGILYDVKSRLEHESVLFSIASKYERFEFRPKGAFDIDGCKSSLVNVLKEAFSSIIENKDAYIKQVASEKKDWIDAFESLLIHRSKIEDPIFKPIHENIDKSILSRKKDVEKITQESFDILKAKQHEFIQWITRLLDEEHATPSLREAITSLECLYSCYTFTFIAGRPEPWPDEVKKCFWGLQHKIESWESYFEWLIVRQDMSCAKTSLEKLDYFEKNFAETIDFNRLDFFAKKGDYTHFENEIREISKKLNSYLIFKDIYHVRKDFGLYEDWDYILSHDESLRYKWFHCDINAIIKENDSQEMKKYLEFLEYEVLENEIYYPDTPQFKKDFLEFLKNIDSLIKAHFNDGELLSYAKHIGKTAQSKLENINKEIDIKSVNVFKDDVTHNIILLKITKKLLMRVVCYITSMDDVEIRKKLMDKPLLDHNGNLTIKRSFLKEIKNELGEKKYDNPLYDDLQAYLNFIFGVSGHYQYHNGRACEKTIFDLYGKRIFLYLVRVTFEMSQLEISKRNAS